MDNTQNQTTTGSNVAGDVTDQELSQAEMELDGEMAQTQAALAQEQVVDEMLAADAAEDTQATTPSTPMETPVPPTMPTPPMETPTPVEMPTPPVETPAMPATPPAADVPADGAPAMPQADVTMGDA